MTIHLALATGMRKSEILRLTWERIDFNNKTVKVMQTLRDDGSIKKQQPSW